MQIRHVCANWADNSMSLAEERSRVEDIVGGGSAGNMVRPPAIICFIRKAACW
jgi:hypothetical protein